MIKNLERSNDQTTGTGNWFSRATAVVAALGATLLLGLNPASAQVSLGEYSAVLTWNANPSPAVAGYRVIMGPRAETIRSALP